MDPANPGMLAAGAVTGEARRERLLELLGQVRYAQTTVAPVTSSLDDRVVAELWSARAATWEGLAAEAFRLRCLGLETDVAGVAETMRLAYAWLDEARLIIESEYAELNT